MWSTPNDGARTIHHSRMGVNNGYDPMFDFQYKGAVEVMNHQAAKDIAKRHLPEFAHIRSDRGET